MKILVSWSSGKDSAWMLHVLNQDPAVEIGGLLTTMNEQLDRVAMHAVKMRCSKRKQRCRHTASHGAVALALHERAYEERMRAAVASVAEGFTHVAFGDLFSKTSEVS